MIYLTGVTNDRDEDSIIEAGIGLMAQPGNSYHLRVGRYPCYAYDNGCFNDRWEEDAWLRWLEPLPAQRCLFAVAPDVYADARASLERGARYFGLVRELGFPVALVAQDGAESLDIPWDDFDALFIGGRQMPDPRREWKVSAAAAGLVRSARRAGKWVHMGRVNSQRRFATAKSMGCHSADGTTLKYRLRRKGAHVDAGLDPARSAGQVSAWVGLVGSTFDILSPREAPMHPTHRLILSGGE